MKFIPTDYTGRHVIHCPSKEAWDKVTEVLDSYGLITVSGRSFKSLSWSSYDCIRFMVGTLDKYSFFLSNPDRYILLEYDDFEWGDDQEPLEIELGFEDLFK